jgi:hypothetical protein
MRCDETLRGTERISAELVGVHCQTTGLWLVGLKGHLAGSMICFKAVRTDVPFSSATFLDAIYVITASWRVRAKTSRRENGY